MRTTLLIACFAMVGSAANSVFGQSGQALVFDDGGDHLIRRNLLDTVLHVENASQLTMRASVSTNLNPDVARTDQIVEILDGSKLVIDGGSIEDTDGRFGSSIVAARDGSTIDFLSGSVSGGNLVGVRLVGSELNMSDGMIWSGMRGVKLTQDAIARFSGGSIQNKGDGGFGAVADDNSQIMLMGGTLSGFGTGAVGVQLNNSAELLVTGGSLLAMAGVEAGSITALEQTGSSSAQISGGRIGFRFGIRDPTVGIARLFHLQGDSQLVVSGGRFDFEIGDDPPRSSRIFETFGSSRLTVSGGTFTGLDFPDVHIDLTAMDQSQVTIVGSDFNYPLFEPISATESEITGTLLDGNDISWTFTRAPSATIVLVPEPSGGLLLLMGPGICWLHVRRMRYCRESQRR